MNEADINKRGLEGIQPLLTKIEQKQDIVANAFVFSAELMREGVDSLSSIGVSVDMRNPRKYLLSVGQGGLGLPDKTYYSEAQHADIRRDYVVHVQNVLNISGIPLETASGLAEGVLAFETKIAQASLKRDEMRDPERLYNNMDLRTLIANISSLNWADYFRAALAGDYNESVGELQDFNDLRINIEVPQFFSGLAESMQSTPVEHLVAYFKFHTLHSYSSALHQLLRDESFDFYGKRLNGQEQQPPRWKKCVSQTDNSLGELLGLEYSSRFFDVEDKRIAQTLIKAVEEAFRKNLNHVHWMDTDTRQATEEKLNKIANNIGFPAKPETYNDVSIGATFFENIMKSKQFEISKEIRKIPKDVDREEWEMSAPTVNAYYDPSKNKMVFPAGILQYPLFDRRMPAAVNFGSIGAIMGHELSHAFDDEGRKFDGEGNMRDWWSAEALKGFETGATCVEKQFNSFSLPVALANVTTLTVNGKLTLGENIADLGGVKAAYYAFQEYKRTRPPSHAHVDHPPTLRRWTEDKLFFVSYAQSWCELVRDQYSQLLISTDHGSFAPLAFQPSAMTNCANQRFLSY